MMQSAKLCNDKIIIEYRGMIMDFEYIKACEDRRKSVERVLAILFTATNGPDTTFMDVLESYIYGEITLEEMETKVDSLEYLGV